MFKNLTDFGHRRNKKEAFGFYLAYLLLVMIAGALCAFVAGSMTGTTGFSNGFALGTQVGSVVAVIVSVALSFTILAEKRVLRFGFVLLSLVSGILAIFGGGLLGLIIPACFTTLHPSATPTASSQ